MEQKILHELMEVVQQRDALVALLEEDRLKSVVDLLFLHIASATLILFGYRGVHGPKFTVRPGPLNFCHSPALPVYSEQVGLHLLIAGLVQQ